MSNITVTYSFTNGTSADADQVNQNFTDILNGLSDGTKDISISAMTCAGTVTLNGNTTIGNAATDTITVTGRVSSDVYPIANSTYDLGSSSLYWAESYVTTHYIGSNVSINGTSPAAKIHIQGLNGVENGLLISGVSGDTSGDGYHIGYDSSNNCRVWTKDGNNILIGVENVEKVKFTTTAMTINDLGNDYDVIMKSNNDANMFYLNGGDDRIGIGTNPSAKFHVLESVDSAVAAKIEQTDADNPYGLNIDFSAGSPDDNTRWFLACEDSTASRCIIYSDGDVWTSDAGTLTSDKSFKDNIVDTEPQKSRLMGLRVRNFKWKKSFHPKKDKKKNIGFIAQEFESHFPEFVCEAEMKVDGEKVVKKGIKYTALVPVIVKALQEQEDDLTAIRERLDALEAS